MLPLLFLDVDGPLIPFGAATPYPVHEPSTSAHPLLPRVDPALGPQLLSLPCELVWATTWMTDANDLISPRLGLPPLPVVEWPEPSALDDQDKGLHWKTRHLVTWAAGRAFAWIDDELTATDQAWVDQRHPAPALLYRVEAQKGLQPPDLAALHQWLTIRTTAYG
ncbi:hypothetical protein DZF91_35985 [Actinomadura logoneensis]|uniref:Secreted protein n=1 Tax=Actinomadura logoneensis TaxID=2293572 RepID=A0A372J9Z4_9ACTN|nr:hypothetical protein DZF91_35985 [Actinomadura logoneensis]